MNVIDKHFETSSTEPKRVLNPNTGRWIKYNGLSHKKLQRGGVKCDKISSDPNMRKSTEWTCDVCNKAMSSKNKINHERTNLHKSNVK